MQRKEVKSGLIHSLGYDEATQTLEVEFAQHKAGLPRKVYTYTPFPPERYAAFVSASSFGKYFLAYIKDDKTLTYKRVEDASEEKTEAAAPPPEAA